MAWHILLTTPGAEFKVRDELHRKGTWALVPVEFKLSKRKESRPLRRPVMPGYVFAKIDNWTAILQPSIRTVRVGDDDFAHEPGALRPMEGLRARPVATFEGRPVELTKEQVDALEILSRPASALKTPGKKLRPGDRIRIKVGAFAQLSALVDAIGAKGRAVAIVELFGRPTPVVLKRNEYEAA